MHYASVGGAVIAQHPITPGHTITFVAEDIGSSARTGVRARLRILLNGVQLSWSLTAIERDDERVRLANSAWGHLSTNGVSVDFPKPYLKYELDDFCSGLWEAHVGAQLATPLAGLAAHTPPDLVAPGVIAGGGTLLYGPPERGKSWLLLALAVSIDAGVDLLFPVAARPVLLVNLERSSDSMADRLGAVNRCLGLPSERPLLMLNARGRSLADIAAAVARSRMELGPHAVLAVDSLSRAGAGDLNENVVANQIMDQLNALAETWVGVAHTPRADSSHVYGSVHFEAACDVAVSVLGELRDDERGVGMLITKANDLPSYRPPVVTAFRFASDAGLVAVRRAQLKEFPEMGLGVPISRLEQVTDALRELGGRATASQVAEVAELPRATVARLLSSSERFVRLPRQGKDAPYGLAGKP